MTTQNTLDSQEIDPNNPEIADEIYELDCKLSRLINFAADEGYVRKIESIYTPLLALATEELQRSRSEGQIPENEQKIRARSRYFDLSYKNPENGEYEGGGYQACVLDFPNEEINHELEVPWPATIKALHASEAPLEAAIHMYFMQEYHQANHLRERLQKTLQRLQNLKAQISEDDQEQAQEKLAELDQACTFFQKNAHNYLNETAPGNLEDQAKKALLPLLNEYLQLFKTYYAAGINSKNPLQIDLKPITDYPSAIAAYDAAEQQIQDAAKGYGLGASAHFPKLDCMRKFETHLSSFREAIGQNECGERNIWTFYNIFVKKNGHLEALQTSLETFKKANNPTL